MNEKCINRFERLCTKCWSRFQYSIENVCFGNEVFCPICNYANLHDISNACKEESEEEKDVEIY